MQLNSAFTENTIFFWANLADKLNRTVNIIWVVSCYKQLYLQAKRQMASFVVHQTPSQSEPVEYLENCLS